MALLSLDDLLIVAREFLNPDLSRAALARCLRRHGVGDLRALQRERDGEPEEPAHKPFKDYVPGFVHVDVKYLPQMELLSKVVYGGIEEGGVSGWNGSATNQPARGDTPPWPTIRQRLRAGQPTRPMTR